VVAADRDDAEELRRLHSHQRALGLDAEWLSGSECRAHEPALSPRVAGGILAPHDHQVDPPALVDCLVDAFGRAGGELLSGCGEAAIELDGRGAVVRTPRGDAVMTERVVIAAGAWSARVQGLEDVGGLPVRPVKGQIVSLRAPGSASLPSRTIRSPRCYLLNRGDGRIVLGATVEERGFDDSPTADGVYRLLEAAWEVLPGALELEWVAVRASLRPGSPDNAPLVGPTGDERVVLATGHYRNGVLLAPVTADVVAELLAGDGRASTGERGKLAWSSR
jgi:glycine oxidase